MTTSACGVAGRDRCVDMAVNRAWYSYTMMSRSHSTPLDVRRVPGAVESCLQWHEDAAAAAGSGVVKTTTVTTTKSVERSSDLGPQHLHRRQQRQQQELAEPFADGVDDISMSQYDGRRTTPYDARQNTARYTAKNIRISTNVLCGDFSLF